ncbi:MAG: phosphoenolpyruvate hydrolase family protein [Planctomycetota bacterium]|nr:phosphoenolpyruvate hydrolase family protein [Planctomycetota bacterium]
MAIERSEILRRLRSQIEKKIPIIGAGAGTGISAKFCEKGGVDLIIIYNSGRFRMAGRGSLAGLLPYGDANAIVVDMASEVLPVVEDTPVLAGVCGTDPFRIMDVFLPQLKEMGFSGIQNFPTVGLYDGKLGQNLEETGMGYGLEVELVQKANELDLLTAPYVFDPEQAARMAEAGADVLVPHMGLTTKGSIGAASSLALEDCPEIISAMATAAKEAREDVMVLCHGGPISEPADAQFILQNTPGIDGFFGASSIERLATEPAIREQAAAFKRITF